MLKGFCILRVLALITDAFGGSGGIALYNRDFLTALCSIPNCQEVVVLPRLMPNPSEEMPDKLSWRAGGLGGRGKYIRTLFRLLWKDRDFNFIICAHLHMLPLAWLAKIILRCPLLVELYGIDAWQPTGGYLSRRLVKRVDIYTSISSVTRDRFIAWSGVEKEKIRLLPNALHEGRYGPGPKSSELLARYGLAGKRVIMTLGRMSHSERYKGFDEMLEVLPLIAEEIPDVAYLIVGDGDDRKRLQEKAVSLGLGDRVVFAGFVPENEKADHYRLADVYAMPSHGEGFGFVFLEALACGVPVIGSKLDGSRDALRDGLLGQLVDPEDREELKLAVLKAIGKPKENISQGLEFFLFPAFVSRLHKIMANFGCSKTV